MGSFIDLTGQRFGRLTVQKIAGRNNQGGIVWSCVCDCGNVVKVTTGCLNNGHTTSCGCYRRDNTTMRKTVHGGRKTKLYKVWQGMRERCFYPSHSFYKYYGGRGITVCEEWANSFEAFREWALANGYRDGLTIDRKNTDGPYSPDNCRWATQKEQQSNRRNNRWITYNGETHTLTQWSEITGISISTLWHRIKRGCNVEQAFITK